MYLFDANAFMDASRRYYANDIAPGFWTWLGAPRIAARVASVTAVRDEIIAGKGHLVDWARQRPPSFWIDDNSASLEAMRSLAAWAADPSRGFHQSAVDEFLGAADIRLIAHALTLQATVVTHEQPAPEAKRRIKIPDVCRAFDVGWTDPFSTFRDLGMQLVA